MRTFLRRLSSWWNKKPQQQTPVVLAPTSTTEMPIDSVAEPRQPVNVMVEGSSPTEELVYQALRRCRDPEIPVNIVDLGLIYDVHIAEALVKVKMTLTTQGCGMGGYIAQEAEEQIRALPGVRAATVEIVWDPPWDPSMISQEGKKTLGLPE